MAVAGGTSARERIEQRIAEIGALRGSGPNPFVYNQWDDRTREVLLALFGQDSPELGQYLEAVGVRGRLAGVRGQADNMTLNIHGPWGILARLERGEAALRAIAARQPQG